MIGIECKFINIDKIDVGDKILYSGPCYNKSNKILSTVDNYFINFQWKDDKISSFQITFTINS